MNKYFTSDNAFTIANECVIFDGDFYTEDKFILEADFYIAILDCKNMNADQIYEKCVYYATFNHYLISRPVCIYLVNYNKDIQDALKIFENVKEVKIIYCDRIADINLEIAVSSYYRMKGEMTGKGSDYSLIARSDNNEYLSQKPRNWQITSFFWHVFETKRKNVAVLAAFDYLDMIIRYLTLYTAKRYNLDVSVINNGDIEDMCRFVNNYTEPNDYLRELLDTKIMVNNDLRFLLKQIEKQFPIELVGEELSFLGIAKLLDYLRNRTRGHGVLQGCTVETVWSIVYKLLVLITSFLELNNFVIETTDSEVKVGYDSQELVDLGEFALVNDKQVCLLFYISDTKKKYIDYISGEISVPNIF